jgi:endonuclease/exonuclease/phosphatase family metal-dependent hydrolase
MSRLLPVFLVLALLSCDPCAAAPTAVRVATFNVAMGLDEAGELAAALAEDDNPNLRQVAEILQRVRPDVVLLNEFDYDPSVDAAGLLQKHYLDRSQDGQAPIAYPHHFRAAVNTGVDSGLDLDGDGATGGPGDAWGFGRFPGQYGMLVLSRFPIDARRSRTFQNLRWAALPGARQPVNPDGSPFYADAVWQRLRLSSKSHWDIAIDIAGATLHLLAHHPTPPVFDGPEDRNGQRNFDEIRFWREYTDPGNDPEFIADDRGTMGGLDPNAAFVIAGDFNADPFDGDTVPGAIAQLLDAPWIDASCIPRSAGAVEATDDQGDVNARHRGDPATDTADFNDRYTGNLRLDYVLPATTLEVTGCGVFWPPPGAPGHAASLVSDHRLVWLDVQL